MTKAPSKGHIPGLDLVRVFAVFNVSLYHYTGAFEKIYDWQESPFFMISSSVGVPAFLVLTGYLVPSLLERRSAKIALYHRYARLLPGLIVCSLMTSLVIALYPLREEAVSLITWLANLTMMPNVVGQHFIDGAYWTLQSQMYFFLFICIVKVSGLLPRLHHIFIGVIIFGMVASHFSLLEIPYQWPTPFKQLTNISLSFLQIGLVHFYAIGLVYRHFHTGRYGISEFILLGLCIGYEYAYGVRFFPLFLFLLVLALVSIFVRLSIYDWAPIRFLARVSFCYYLLHMVIGFGLLHYFHYEYGLSPNLLVPMTMGSICLLAAVVERFVERPSYRYLRAHPPAWLDRVRMPVQLSWKG
jgi:peptidoglycan/LPS O-acetylase OafA/YrhL